MTIQSEKNIGLLLSLREQSHLAFRQTGGLAELLVLSRRCQRAAQTASLHTAHQTIGRRVDAGGSENTQSAEFTIPALVRTI